MLRMMMARTVKRAKNWLGATVMGTLTKEMSHVQLWVTCHEMCTTRTKLAFKF